MAGRLSSKTARPQRRRSEKSDDCLADANHCAQSHEAVLRAAQTLFMRQGYQASSVDCIARGAGLPESAVHVQFDDKIAILRELLGRFAQRLEPVLADLANDSIDPRTRLIGYIHWIASTATTDAEAMLLPIPLSIEFLDRDGAVPALLASYYEPVHAALTRVVSDGQRQGEFAAAHDASHLATVVMALQQGILLEWSRRRHAIDGEALVGTLRGFILGAVAPRQASAETPVPRGRRPLEAMVIP